MDMLACHKQEADQTLATVAKELEDSKNEIVRLTAQESALVQQNAKTSVMMTSEEKKRFAASRKRWSITGFTF